MRIKQISKNEVSVYLTAVELEEFDFPAAGEALQKENLHNFLFNIMEIVHNETGFKPYDGGQLVVEAVNFPDGMRLHISRIGAPRRKKLTREQFGKVHGISVKNKDEELKALGATAYAEFVKIMREVEREIEMKKMTTTFIFDNFTFMESALCSIKDEELGKCVLYRSGVRYAIVTKTARSGRLYNILSEYCSSCCGGDVLAADIDEGWQELVRGEQLKEMAAAVRSMR